MTDTEKRLFSLCKRDATKEDIAVFPEFFERYETTYKEGLLGFVVKYLITLAIVTGFVFYVTQSITITLVLGLMPIYLLVSGVYALVLFINIGHQLILDKKLKAFIKDRSGEIKISERYIYKGMNTEHIMIDSVSENGNRGRITTVSFISADDPSEELLFGAQQSKLEYDVLYKDKSYRFYAFGEEHLLIVNTEEKEGYGNIDQSDKGDIQL